MQNKVKGGREGVTWSIFEILENPSYLWNGWN